MRYYDISILQYENTQFVHSDCNSITFINYGTANVVINQAIILANGQSFTIEGNEDEMCIEQFLLTFTGAGTSNCVVVRKIYVNKF